MAPVDYTDVWDEDPPPPRTVVVTRVVHSPSRPPPPIPEEPSPRSVVLVTIDCLRADFVSWGGDYDATLSCADRDYCEVATTWGACCTGVGECLETDNLSCEAMQPYF